MDNYRKVVLIGCGLVGMSFAYSLLSQKGIDELVLIDIDEKKIVGEAMDLSHGLPYAESKMNIKAGNYDDCCDASIIVISAGANQKVGQTRLELTKINTKIMIKICENIRKKGFNGIMIIASNPVDLMTYVAQKVLQLPYHQIIGSGTLLDTARLRYMIGKYLDVNNANVHAYILGEHGDTSFVSWTHAYIGCKPLLELLDEKNRHFDDLLEIYEDVKNAAYEIIDRKKATYYGIGLSLNALVSAILNNENSIMSISAYQNHEYGKKGLYIGVPAIINRKGVKEIMKLELNEVDQVKFDYSCEKLLSIIHDSIDPILKS